MEKSDLDRLWSLPWFDRALRSHYDLDLRRHLRWDLHSRTIYYIVRRSAPLGSQAVMIPGRFPIDEKTLRWLMRVEYRGWVEYARIVLVEDWRAPVRVVNHITALGLWDRVDTIVPFSGTDNTYWWVDDNFEPQDAWLGPVLTTPPF